MKNNDNSPHSLDINSIPGSGMASYSIWSSPQPCEVSAYLIPVLGMGIMRHREDKEIAQGCTTREAEPGIELKSLCA